MSRALFEFPGPKKTKEEDEERREREDGCMSRAWGVHFKWEQAEDHLGLELKLNPSSV